MDLPNLNEWPFTMNDAKPIPIQSPDYAAGYDAGFASGVEAVMGKLRDEAEHSAEFQDKWIHPCGGEAFQTYRITMHLPVAESDVDRSVGAAVQRWFAAR